MGENLGRAPVILAYLNQKLQGDEIHEYRIVIKKDQKEDVHIVTVPSLPGCHTFGKMVEEAIEVAKRPSRDISKPS